MHRLLYRSTETGFIGVNLTDMSLGSINLMKQMGVLRYLIESIYIYICLLCQASMWYLDLVICGREKIHVVDLGALPEPHGYCTESWRSAIDRQVQEVT